MILIQIVIFRILSRSERTQDPVLDFERDNRMPDPAQQENHVGHHRDIHAQTISRRPGQRDPELGQAASATRRGASLKLAKAFSMADKLGTKGKNSKLWIIVKKLENVIQPGKPPTKWGIICFRCGGSGHITWQCPKRLGDQEASERESEIEKGKGPKADHKEQIDCSFGQLNRTSGVPKAHSASLDWFCDYPSPSGFRLCTNHGPRTNNWSSTRQARYKHKYGMHPRQSLIISVMNKSEEMSVGFAQMLPCLMLLGWDWP